MARSQVSLKGFIEALPGGYKSLNPADWINLNPPEAETQLQLQSGANTIAIPANSVGCLIVFSADSTVTKTLKGVTGDTGIPINRNNWMVLTFQNAGGSFVITASAIDEIAGPIIQYTRIIFF